MKNMIGFIMACFAVTMAAPAAEPEMPDVFMNRVFAKYKDMGHWPKGYKPCNEFCEPAFAKLAAKLDYDPICQCQKPGGKYAILKGTMHGPESFEFTVRDFNHPIRLRQWIVMLRDIRGQWKITDVVERRLDGRGSVRERLSKHS